MQAIIEKVMTIWKEALNMKSEIKIYEGSH